MTTNSILHFEELAIAISTTNYNPNLVSWNFLQSKKIIPSNWQLKENLILEPQLARLQFTNGTIISAQLNDFTFSQTIEDKFLDNVKLPKIVRQYIEVIPRIEYTGIGINFSVYITFEHPNQDLFGYYIANSLLASKNFQNFSNQPPIVTIQIQYVLDNQIVILKIDDVQLHSSNNSLTSDILVSAYFPREIDVPTLSLNKQDLFRSIDNWQNYLKIFRQLINEYILDND